MNEQESKRILEESLKGFAKKPKDVEETPPEESEVEKLEKITEEVEYEHLTNKKPLFIGVGVVSLVLIGIAISIFYYGFSDEGLPNSREIASKQIDKMLTPRNNSNEIQKEQISETMQLREETPEKPATKNEALKELNEEPISEKDSYTEKIISIMETWEGSWENGNFNTFINLYSKDFNSDGMNYDSWSKKKSRSLRNKGIQVGVSDLKIIKQGNILIVNFIQNYKSKTISDIGKKTIKFKQEKGSYKIFSEKWKKIR